MMSFTCFDDFSDEDVLTAMPVQICGTDAQRIRQLTEELELERVTAQRYESERDGLRVQVAQAQWFGRLFAVSNLLLIGLLIVMAWLVGAVAKA
jgi:hypothetical protein